MEADNMIFAANKHPSGMFGFTLVWLGHIVSELATNMSALALTIWVFIKTGSATALGAGFGGHILMALSIEMCDS